MAKTISDHKEEIISDLIRARQAITSEIKALPAERIEEPCVGFWCLKDLLAHLIGWDFTNLQAVEEILGRQRPTFFQYYDKDWQSYNARLVAAYRKEPFDALLADAKNSHHQLVTFLQSLSASELVNGKSPPEQGRTVTIRTLLRSEAGDERKHAGQIHAFLYSAKPLNRRYSCTAIENRENPCPVCYNSRENL